MVLIFIFSLSNKLFNITIIEYCFDSLVIFVFLQIKISKSNKLNYRLDN